MTFGLYNKQKSDQIREFVERHDDVDRDQSFSSSETKEPEWFFVKMKEDLLPATDEETEYTQAQAQVVKYKYDDSTTLDREAVINIPDEIKITNRSKSSSLSKDEYTWVRFIGAEYVPFLGGSPGTLLIDFQVLKAECVGCNATATVISRPVGLSVVPGEEYGIVTVTDIKGCFLTDSNDNMVGMLGTAMWVFHDPEEVGQVSRCPLAASNIWSILSMCCIEGGDCVPQPPE